MLKRILCGLSGAVLLVAAAAPASIGIVKSTGTFKVDGASIPGNGTLFEGNIVETAGARTVAEIGALRLTLLPSSRARIFRDRTVLESGGTLLSSATQHTIEADVLRIQPISQAAVLQVEIPGRNRVTVLASRGTAEVRNPSGVLVANLRPGVALAFELRPGAEQTVTATGKLTMRGGHYFLTDSTTNVVFELQGTNLAQYVGKTVTISGAAVPGTPEGGASQLVGVTSIAEQTVTGLSMAAKAAIVGGVAVGGTVAGLGAAGTFSQGTPASR